MGLKRIFHVSVWRVSGNDDRMKINEKYKAEMLAGRAMVS